MSTGVLNNIHYLKVPPGLLPARIPEIKAELDRVLADIIDHGLTKLVLDLSDLNQETPAITSFIFKAMEDCATLRIQVRYVVSQELSRILFGIERSSKLAIYKDLDLAVADF